jgi:hypothetical protein
MDSHAIASREGRRSHRRLEGHGSSARRQYACLRTAEEFLVTPTLRHQGAASVKRQRSGHEILALRHQLAVEAAGFMHQRRSTSR